MEYKKIENLIYKQNMINRLLFRSNKEYNLELDKMLIDNINKCINKGLELEMNEKDFSKIYKTYLRLIKNGYKINPQFINDLANISSKKIDYLKVIDEITE